jgi:AcrR family transcriptional regulator
MGLVVIAGRRRPTGRFLVGRPDEPVAVSLPPLETRVTQIYGAAAHLFVEKGFAATSMSEIAAAVGITKAGLYHFVASKDDLALNLITWAYDVYDREVHIPAQGISDPLDRLRFIVRSHLYNVGQNRAGVFGNPVTVLLDDPAALTPKHRRQITRRKGVYFAFLRDTLAALKERGELIDVDPTVAAFSVLGVILWLARWHKPGGRLTLDDIVAEMTEITLRGVIRPEVLEAKGVFATLRPATPPALESLPRGRRRAERTGR